MSKVLYVVGIGPGEEKYITLEAKAALDEAEVLAGYNTYIDLVKDRYPDKEYIMTGMTKETERCRLSLESANAGKVTALVCSGDSSVYGMAGLVLELSVDYPDVEVIVIPGITAALSGGALLGAALGHDFAVVSLSDRLTPWETIEKRLLALAQTDFVISIYNPSSKGRPDYLKKACDILLKEKSPETVCGYVKNIGRDGCEKWTGTLEELRNQSVDMFTTVFVGNSETVLINGKMVTKRGYRL